MAEEEGTTGQPTILKKEVDSSIENEDSGITMIDVLEEEQELEDDANAVLGGSDDQNCTYPQGYVKRQALYACKTCASESQELAGICLACSYACHEGHDLFELYTKRKFCCDCGNSKFSKNPCKLYPNKVPYNKQNVYNQNFQGLYCICSRPYPDPENDIEDEMIQCIVCEDWYHGRHLGTSIPPGNNYGEYICSDCMGKCDFLWHYVVHDKVVKIEKTDVDEAVDVGCETTPSVIPSSSTPNTSNTSHTDTEANHGTKESTSIQEPKKEIPSFSEDQKPSEDTKSFCKLAELKKQEVASVTGGIFWPDGWREKLCTCAKCKDLYTERNMSYLLDLMDTVHSYEEQGKAKNTGQSQYDQGMQALSRLDRIRQVEAIHEYNSMKSQLKNYLKSFAENRKVVRKEDIDEFFTQMRERKRRRIQTNIPQFCR